MDKKILLGLVSRRPWKYTEHKQKKTFIQNVIKQHTQRVLSIREIHENPILKKEITQKQESIQELEQPLPAVIKHNKNVKRHRPLKEMVNKERKQEETKTKPPFLDESL